MDTRDALGVLELEAGAPPEAVRSSYRRLLRTHHPDVAGAAGHERTARLIEAYRVLVEGGTLPATDPPVTDPPAADVPAPTPDVSVPDVPPPEPTPAAGVPLADDSFAVDAPAEETFLLLHEAAGRIGEIAYLDPDLGLLETVVRFEGGPTCSLLLTLQGRAGYTEVLCTLASLEAAPAPPIGPAVDALVDELVALA